MKTRIMIAAVVILALVGLYFGWRYYGDVIQPEQELAAADGEQLALFDNIRPAPAKEQDSVPENGDAPLVNPLAEAESVNPSVVGWITIPGTHIDYPIAQAEDNDFYLHNGFDGQYNYELGCPFLDYRCEADFSGFNSIVYAHHMTKQRMFADINLFKDESFFSSHNTGQLILNNDVHTVQFFAYLNVYPTAPAYHAVFVMDSEKQEYLEYIEETADYCLYSTDELINMTSSDDRDSFDNLHLLLISTCTYEFEDARGILVGFIE